MSKLPITAIVATKNEEANIAKCLRTLAPAERVIVVDSQSTDRTAAIAQEQSAEVVQFEYRGGYPKKRQWVLDTAGIQTPWVFMVDADEEVPPALWAEIEEGIGSESGPDGFVIRKGFHFLGKRLRHGGFSHTAILLWRHGRGRFEETLATDANRQDMEVHERVLISGSVRSLATPIIHNDFKGLSAYLDRHNKYSSWEAELRHRYLQTGRWGEQTIEASLWGGDQELRRFVKGLVVRTPFEPYLWFMFHYVAKLGFLEGRRGLIASQIRMAYIREVRSKMYELSLRNDQSSS